MPPMNKFQFDPTKHHRRSIRLKGYDYASEGAYFVTTVTLGRECLFGEIVDGEMSSASMARWFKSGGMNSPYIFQM